MATYAELFELRNDSGLRNRVTVAIIKKAQALIDLTTPLPEQIAWANDAITDPVTKARRILNYVLAANSGADVDTIKTVADTAIQTNVDAAVDALIAGGA